MVSMLHSRSSGPSSSPDGHHGIVFLSKTLYTHTAFSIQVFLNGTYKCNAGSNPVMDLPPI